MIMCIVILIDDGLLRNNKGTSGPSTSLTSYIVSLKNTVISTVSKEVHVGNSVITYNLTLSYCIITKRNSTSHNFALACFSVSPYRVFLITTQRHWHSQN